MIACLRFGVVGLFLATLAGCNSRVDFTKTPVLMPGEVQTFSIDPPKAEQKVEVEFSADAPVSIILCANSEKEAVETYLTINGKKLPTVLGKCENVKSGTISATVPAKTAFNVMCVALDRKTEMKLKVTSK